MDRSGISLAELLFICIKIFFNPFPQLPELENGSAISIITRQGHMRSPLPLEKVAATPMKSASANAVLLDFRLENNRHAANISATTIIFCTEQRAQHVFS